MRDNLWMAQGGFGTHRARRGDMAPIILNLLRDKPMHGYEIISNLEEKSHGMWRPSAGSIYPNLQLLEEQGLVVSENQDDKKVYSLTDKGREEADRVNERFKHRWQERDAHAQTFKELKMTFFDTMGILRDIASQNSEEKNDKVRKILNHAKEELATLRDQ
jgi:DNA-binding PadR family transcriptional regulator